MENTSTQMLKEYDEKCLFHEEFASSILQLISQLLQINKIHVHSINTRVKTKDSLSRKLDSSPGKYKSLNDVTDICGLRIITFFEDDVSKVTKIIEKEFIIDAANSADKLSLLDPDRFGYRSIHYVVSLSKNRSHLAENQRFSDCKIEIQIRSILQHAWAEMEHDLGYKNNEAIPDNIRRQFSRLAGLLELGDIEFIRIRNDINNYKKSIPNRIVNTPTSVLINKDSLEAYVKHSDLVKSLDSETTTLTNTKLHSQISLDFELERLPDLGFKTISDIENGLKKYKNQLPKFAALIFSKHEHPFHSNPICIFYLCYYELISTKSKQVVVKYLNKWNVTKNPEWIKFLFDSFEQVNSKL